MIPVHNDDEIIITETPRVLEIRGVGCIIRAPDLSGIRYMAHRLEIRNITLGTLGWIPEWILEVYLENCELLANSVEPGDKLMPTASTNLPQTVIQLTCRGCNIPQEAYQQLVHHRLVRLELINQGLTRIPRGVSDYASNLLFLNLASNQLSQPSVWPVKIRGLRLAGNKLSDLAHLGQLPPYLEDLDLSNNLFSEIPVGELSQFLQKLNMAQNELNWLPEDASEYPPNLRELNIARNCGLDDLTDAAMPDMLKTLIAAECEIAKLPHEWTSYCLTNMDVSDNNITNLDELPFDKVMNINYVGNPCWQPSRDSSPDISVNGEGDQDGFIDDGIAGTELPGQVDICKPGTVNTGEELDEYLDDYGMTEYKAAISRSSSQEELQKVNNGASDRIILNIAGQDDPLIRAIDYVVASGFRKVGSFLSVVSDILTPDINEESIYASPSNRNNSIAGQVLDDLESYGILGSFD